MQNKIILSIFLFLYVTVSMAQRQSLELSILHSQLTLPWGKLPAHQLHPGVRLAYLSKKKPTGHWLKEAEIFYQRHKNFYNSLAAGAGLRYRFLKNSSPVILNAGAVAGISFNRPTQTVYEQDETGNWLKQKPGAQPKGYLALQAKAGYQFCKQLGAGASIRVSVMAPYEPDFSIALPMRSYEIFVRYHF